MKKIFLVFLIIGVADASAFAQNNILGRIIYDYSFVQNSDNPNNPIRDKMVLQFNKSSSVFQSQLYIETKAAEKKRLKSVLLQSADNRSSVDNGQSLVRGSNVRYYNFYKEGMNYQYFPAAGNIYLIKQPLENIEWKILNEVKGIGGFGCQKAMGKSHGRTYIVWFTTDIPYSYGPRKLWGLPGMILEATDTESQIVYKLLSVDLNPVPEETIEMPKNGIVTTHAEYIKMVQAFSNNANTGQENSQGLTVTEVGGSSRPVRKPVVNKIDRD